MPDGLLLKSARRSFVASCAIAWCGPHVLCAAGRLMLTFVGIRGGGRRFDCCRHVAVTPRVPCCLAELEGVTMKRLLTIATIGMLIVPASAQEVGVRADWKAFAKMASECSEETHHRVDGWIACLDRKDRERKKAETSLSAADLAPLQACVDLKPSPCNQTTSEGEHAEENLDNSAQLELNSTLTAGKAQLAKAPGFNQGKVVAKDAWLRCVMANDKCPPDYHLPVDKRDTISAGASAH
jgi:hypothetical protein